MANIRARQGKESPHRTRMFFDSHSHLHDEKFARDIEPVIARAKAAGVDRILTLGDTLTASRRALALARRAPEVLAAVGVHPNCANEWNDRSEAELHELAESPRAVLIGEIGLDYHYHTVPHDRQRAVFRRQLAIAREHNMAVSIHCREAYADTIADLRAEKAEEIGGVLHCFGGTREDAQALIDLGFYLGVGGSCTYPKSDDLRETLRTVGLNHLLLETDSPYLSPQQKRGRRNEPAHIPIIARFLAEFLEEPYRDVARVTTYNTERAFRLSKEHLPQAVYVTRNAINVNLTNACSNHCEFCQRRGEGMVRGHQLILETPPKVTEIVEALGKAEYAAYKDVIFSGLGEALYRLDDMTQIGIEARRLGKRVLLQTNGQGLLLHGDALWDRLKLSVDSIAVSLNAPNQKLYNELCHPADPERAFPSILEFIREARRRGFNVFATALVLPEVDLSATRALCSELGIELCPTRLDPILIDEPVH